jgi:hypothetical protein
MVISVKTVYKKPVVQSSFLRDLYTPISVRKRASQCAPEKIRLAVARILLQLAPEIIDNNFRGYFTVRIQRKHCIFAPFSVFDYTGPITKAVRAKPVENSPSFPPSRGKLVSTRILSTICGTILVASGVPPLLSRQIKIQR